MDCGLNGKVVLITGGSTGIGKATAELFGREPGVCVALTYKTGRERALETVARIEAHGCTAMAVSMDLGDKEGIDRAVEEVKGRFGGVDVLVNNAVQWPTERFALEEGPVSAWESFFSVNLSGIVKLCQAVVPSMKSRRWGRIVLLSSDLAIDSMKGSGRYSTLKAALFGFAANLVTELSPFDILTNVVLPSWTLTERAQTRFPQSFREVAVAAFPTGRVTTPEDVASLILYLGSGANGHVNGERIRVTGGSSLPLMTYLWDQARAATP
ncbi:MAG: SDR family oxidoreductase [Spirochaetia bacterium]|jgi:3-oxoacyl-[acyl-carrier protein] reductase